MLWVSNKMSRDVRLVHDRKQHHFAIVDAALGIARGAASPSQHVRPSGWSDILELITEQSPRAGV